MGTGTTPAAIRRRAVAAALPLALGLLAAAPPARSEPLGALTVRFNGLETQGGPIVFALADSRERFESEDRTLRVAKVPVQGTQGAAVFEALPPGEYAVKVFHDVNDNGELDIGWRGPKEPYGFSNDVMGFMGPPDFDAAKFEFDGSDRTVDIEAR